MATKYFLLLTFLHIFLFMKADLPDDLTIITTNCTIDDVTDDNCTLTCQLDYADEPENVIGQWLYSGVEVDLTENVTIFDGSCSSNSADSFLCSLDLTSYYAGFYSCYYKIKDSSGKNWNESSSFKIDDSVDGQLMNENCKADSECLAYDAQCSTKKCKCLPPNNIPFSSETDNIACLSASDENGPCNIDDQCSTKYPLKQLYCIEQKCSNGVPLMETCSNDKSCSVKIDNSFCDNGVCQCPDTASVSSDLKHCQASTVSIKKQGCAPGDFTPKCTLSCIATTPNANYKLAGFKWIYKSFRNSTHGSNATIFGGSSEATETSYTETLTLETYNSGYYFCQFTFLNDSNVLIDDVNAVFQIAPTDGAKMGKPCVDSVNCATLNANCAADTKVCDCAGDYSVEYNLDPDTPACLSMEAEGGSCNIKTQCIQADQSFDCVNNTCTCAGTKTYISETGETLCIAPSYYGSGCRYNEQCALSNPNTACNNLLCGCVEDREYSDSTFQCEKTLSGGAISGIVIGCLVGVAAIVVVIICLVRK